MIHSMKSCKYVTAHGKLDGLLDVLLLEQEDGTVMISTVIVIDDEVHISKV